MCIVSAVVRRALAKLVVAVAVACALPALSPGVAAGCLAYAIPDWVLTGQPTLLATAVITEVDEDSFVRYRARTEQIYLGQLDASFGLISSDGCHIPVMSVGQRIALLAGPFVVGGGQAGPGEFDDSSGPIWILNEAGAVLPRQFQPANNMLPGPALNGVTPTTLADILRLAGAVPDTAIRIRPYEWTWAGILLLMMSSVMLATTALRDSR